MVLPLIRERYTIEPFALAPDDEGAQAALSGAIGQRQLDWQPTPIDQGSEEQFIERWMSWFAEASGGALEHPSSMPEHSGGRYRRGK